MRADPGALQNGGRVQRARWRWNCRPVALPDARFVALTSFAYNIVRAVCGSSSVKLINRAGTG
ncbi:hypothetical protein ACOJBM_22510 [Rhizobium beringeri]